MGSDVRVILNDTLASAMVSERRSDRCVALQQVDETRPDGWRRQAKKTIFKAGTATNTAQREGDTGRHEQPHLANTGCWRRPQLVEQYDRTSNYTIGCLELPISCPESAAARFLRSSNRMRCTFHATAEDQVDQARLQGAPEVTDASRNLPLPPIQAGAVQ